MQEKHDLFATSLALILPEDANPKCDFIKAARDGMYHVGLADTHLLDWLNGPGRPFRAAVRKLHREVYGS
jgi:hypothetical protein